MIVTDDDKDYVDVVVSTLSGKKTIRSTAHHPFYDAGQQVWVDAAELESGDLLQTPGDGRAEVLSARSYPAAMRTYNLTVDSVHTYYVMAGKTPVLVHNSNICGAGLSGVGASSSEKSGDSIPRTTTSTPGILWLASGSKSGSKMCATRMMRSGKAPGTPARVAALTTGSTGRATTCSSRRVTELLSPCSHCNHVAMAGGMERQW